MSHLDARQRQALVQFQDLTNGTDDDVAINILDTVGWDVQRAVDLVFDTNSSTPSPMQPFEIDDSQVNAPRQPRPTLISLYQLARPIFSIVTYPFHIFSNILRFIFGILRIPMPHLTFSTLSLYRPIPRRRPRETRGGPDRWVRELEEETGAVSIGTSIVGSSTATDAAGPSNLRARSQPSEDGVKVLPDFTLGSYDEVLRICQKEARIGCIIIVSEEHDDVAEFKRSTLTDPTFVTLLHENNVVVWGGDVRDQEAWSAAEKLQATTYPFVAFVALQPRRSLVSSSAPRPSNSPPTLTVLSRHQGPSIPTGPTSAQTLSDHLMNQLLPRVTPFLERIHATQRERERDRLLREEQDRAFQDSARRDRERIEGRMEEERKEQERRKLEAEEVGRWHEKEEERKRNVEERMEWRKWMRRMQTQEGDGPIRGVRVAVRLPSGGRVMRVFDDAQTLTALYMFVDVQLIPERFERRQDPIDPPGGSVGETLEACVEAQIEKDGEEGGWWGFQLALAYPRQEIPWKKGVRLSEVESLRGGGQVVVEMMGNGPQVRDGDDDGYSTEESE